MTVVNDERAAGWRGLATLLDEETQFLRRDRLGSTSKRDRVHVFFKLTGPSNTIAAQQAAFDQMLASIRPE